MSDLSAQNFENNPRDYILARVEAGLWDKDTIIRDLVCWISTDEATKFVEQSGHEPPMCNCGSEYVDEEGELCEDCQREADIEEFIENHCDEDEHDIEGLRTDIENNNFDIEIETDADRYLFTEQIQASIANGQHKQARTIADDNNIEYRDCLIEALERNTSITDYHILELPSWALCPIVNGDYSGELSEDDEQRIQEFLSDYEGYEFNQFDIEGEGYFSNNPEFGLPTTVVEYVAIKIG